MYGKIFESTFTGSMVGSGATVFAVWSYVIANTKGSRVELNPQFLALILGDKIENVEAAITTLCAEDPRSRSKAHDGRRLVREGEFQYFVPNHEAYRGMRDDDDRREYNRVAKQRSRERQKSTDMSAAVSRGQPRSAQSDAFSEPEAPGTKSGAVQLVFDHWRKTFGKDRAVLDDKRKKIITNALRLYAAQALMNCLSGYSTSRWHLGENDRQKAFVELDLLLRDAKHIEEGIGMFEKNKPGAGAPGDWRKDPIYSGRFDAE